MAPAIAGALGVRESDATPLIYTDQPNPHQKDWSQGPSGMGIVGAVGDVLVQGLMSTWEVQLGKQLGG